MRDKKEYYFNKLRNRATGFPLATVAYYGPDDQFASKVVVGILASENAEPEMRKWFSNTEDLRFSPVVSNEVTDYILSQNVLRVAMLDRIIGCPHEEGIDYPLGETCPQCPFWANRDRWTGEILT